MKKIITAATLLPLGLNALAQTSGPASMPEDGNSFTASTYLELGYDDNIFKRSSDKESDVKEVLGFDFGFQHQGRALDLSMAYDINHERYEDDSFSEDTRFQGSAQARISNYPERYAWYVQHQQSVTNISSQAADTPDNLEQRSVLTTGPDVNFKLSPVDTLTASARYIDVRFKEQDDNDSERTQGQLSWRHRLSELNNIGLNYSYTEASGDSDSASSEYSQQRLGLVYNSQIKWGSYSLEYGETKLERDNNALDDVDGNYASASFNTSWGGESLGLSYNRDVTDSSIGLSQNFAVDSGFSSGDSNFDTIDIIVRTRYQLVYARANANGKLRMTLTLSHDEQDYQTLQEDEESQQLQLGLSYALSQNLRANFTYRLEQTEYTEQPLIGDEDKTSVGLGLTHTPGDNWSFSYSLDYDRRENDDQPTAEYEAAKAIVRMNYRFR